MRRTTWLAGAGLVLALGPGAATAVADPVDVRVGAGQLRISETEPLGAPPNFGLRNQVNVTLSGGTYTVSSPEGATARGTRCIQRPLDANTVDCTASPAEPIDGITAQLKGGDDELNIGENIAVGATVTAGPGNDTVRGGGGGDNIQGEAGQDSLFGRGGNDAINTQGDVTTGIQADGINCGAGTDIATIDERDGFLTADGQLTTTTGDCETVNRPGGPPQQPPPPTTPGGGQQPSINQPTVNPIQQGQQVPTFVPPAPSGVRCTLVFAGTPNPDRFLGSTGGDRMVGLAGNDLMDGLAGSDCLYGGDGNDTLRGGDGNDRLSAGNGNDRADGGNGSDSVYGSAGRDNMLGRDGNDLLSAGSGNDRVSGGSGRDRILAGSGRDIVVAGDGNDVIDTRDGSRDVVSCGSGRDTVRRDRRDRLRNCERRVSRLPRASSR